MGKTSGLPPGYRFHPTDVELVMYYLKKKVMRKRFCSEPIAEIDIYKFAPWDLPERSSSRSGDLKWYFFCPVERKFLNGARMNRATEFGYWKTTGKDRPVNYCEELVGLIKTLIFHLGKAPRGQRTNWVMHEYRLEEKYLASNGVQNTHVLCMIFQKDGPGPRNGAQYGAPFNEQDWSDDEGNCVKTGPSVRLSTPACVLPGNCSSSVLAVNSPPCGTVSESCLSETMRSDCERLPAACTSDIVSKGLPQALGDGYMLPAVVANDDDDDILSVFASFMEDATLISNEDNKNEDDRYDDEENCVKAGPSVSLSTPTCVLPGKCSSSVMAVNSALVGMVSESCLSETMRSDCERLPAVCNIVSKEIPQAFGDGDILLDVLVNNDDDNNVLSVFASFMEDATFISNEDDKNKNLCHGVNEAAHDFDIYKDLEDLGDTAGLSKNGYNFYDQQAIFPPNLRIGVADLDLPLDASPGLPQ